MEKHTLEAVLSMPEELFHNSKVNTVTCAVILTAKSHTQKERKHGLHIVGMMDLLKLRIKAVLMRNILGTKSRKDG